MSWSGYEVSVVLYLLFLCSASELYGIRHSTLSAKDGTLCLHHSGVHHQVLAQQLSTHVRYDDASPELWGVLPNPSA